MHVVHKRFEKGAKESGWNFGNILRSLWQIFHDTPARREDFIQIIGSDLFPVWFCQHRWVEDIKVAVAFLIYVILLIELSVLSQF